MICKIVICKRVICKRTLANALSEKEEAALKAVQTVYFYAKTVVANNTYQEISEWLEFMIVAELANLDSGKNCTFTTHLITENFQNSIAERTNKRLQESPFITVLVDENTDITVMKKLCFYIGIINTDTMW